LCDIPDGTVGSDREPVALFTGEAVHAYLGHLSDETIDAMLNELSIAQKVPKKAHVPTFWLCWKISWPIVTGANKNRGRSGAAKERRSS
jgi:hypothetical protein